METQEKNPVYVKTTAAKYAPAILRIGLAGVFLWFGVNQIIDPLSWVGYIPSFITTFTGMTAGTVVFYNALFEIIAGTMLLLGFLTRIVAVVLFLHLLDIAFTVGLDSIGIRDLGLAVATFVIFLNGMDWLTLDHYIRS
jgi:uncharacterized membrane protein YphA (DoxX/SURF4 family)